MKNGMFCGKVEEEDLRWIANNGFDFAVGADRDEFFSVCRRYSLEPWICSGTFHPPSKRQEYLCVSINGERKEWFSSGCPNNPDVIDFALERYEKVARKDVAGIFCDGIRFASPASGIEAFFTCFCKHCEKKADSFGINFDRMKKDVSTFYARCKEGFPPVDILFSKTPSLNLSYFVSMPGVCDWLWFRKKVITDFVRKLSDIVKGAHKKFGGYLFSPCLSVLVGQNYSSLSQYFDVCSPMLYRNTQEKASIAPINTELHILAEWARKQKNPQWALEFTGLLRSGIKTKMDFLKKGISIEDTAKETHIASQLLNEQTTLIPILWWKDRDIKKTIRKVIDSGASGIQIFWYTQETKKFLNSKISKFL